METEPSRIAKAKRRLTTLALAVSLVGCAGLERSCSSTCAEEFSSDWVVVQFDYVGQPMNCWQLRDTSIANEPNSDGIYWLDGATDNLVHISGWYNRVQVENSRWQEAAQAIGIDLERCTGGKYSVEEPQ